jgi:hypothetical protein
LQPYRKFAAIGGESAPQAQGGGAQPIEAAGTEMTPRAQWFSPSVAKKNPPSLTAAVEAFLAGLSLDGSGTVLGTLTLELARTFEAAPEYARGRLAAELRTLLAVLDAQQAWESELAERRKARARERAWAQTS